MELEWKDKYCSFHASLHDLPADCPTTRRNGRLIGVASSCAGAALMARKCGPSISRKKRTLPQSDHGPQTEIRIAAANGPEHRGAAKSDEIGLGERRVGTARVANLGRVGAPEMAAKQSDEPVAATGRSARTQQRAVTPSSSASVPGPSTTAGSLRPIMATVCTARPRGVSTFLCTWIRAFDCFRSFARLTSRDSLSIKICRTITEHCIRGCY